MNDNLIATTSENGINLIRFNRVEKKNAITAEMYAAMTSALKSGDSDEQTCVHVFMGQPGVFTAGNDLADFLAHSNGDAGLGEDVLGFLRTIITTQKPIIAAVDGLAIGVGTTMLMHCDLVYATERSFFQTPFTQLGLAPEAASSLVGPRLLGRQRAFALLALGERWSAQDAQQAGLINKLVAEDELENIALSAASELAGRSVSSVAITRQLLRGDVEQLLARVDEEAEYFSTQLSSPEAKAAFAAFLK